MALHFENIENIINATTDELISVDDIGEKIALSIQDFFSKEKNIELIEKLKNANIKMKLGQENIPDSDLLAGKTFLFTGALSQFSRSEAQKMVEQNGGKNLSSVSKNLNYLIAGERAGSKLTKAQELGTVKILTENDFLELIKG